MADQGKDLIAIVAGGTGGHILPGICVGEEMLRSQPGLVDVEYYCGQRGIEKLIYESQGLHPHLLRSSINPRHLAPAVKGVCFALDLADALRSFLRRRPRAVLAMGGAVCFPVLTACRILRIPYFLHESNAIPGRVVRLFARCAAGVFLGLGGIEGDNVLVTGTPSKTSAAGEGTRDLILCVGGSQGAEKLNRLFVEAAAKIDAVSARMLLLTGPGKSVANPGRVELREYESDMPSLWRRCRLVVSRAGAGTLAEIANFQVPAVLVPYPFAMDNHQLANAKVFAGSGAAVLAEEKDLTADLLAAEMQRLLSDHDAREAMRTALAAHTSEHSASRIVREILQRTAGAGLSRRLPSREMVTP